MPSRSGLKWLTTLICVASLVTGCRPPTSPTSGHSATGKTDYQEVHLDANHRLWIYGPTKKSKGKHPVVLIAGAGTPLVYGMNLSEGDQAEHRPYAKVGCIVVAYDVSGNHERGDQNLAGEIRAFLDAKAGVRDGQRALDYALKNIPDADPKRVIAIGHSSAATIALQLAEFEPRVTACIAYAPVVDVPVRVEADAEKIESQVPGFTAKISSLSPDQNYRSLKQPLFLFHADDDGNVKAGPIRDFAQRIPNATLVEVPSGGHYQSMIDEGIPAGIAWMRKKGLINEL